MFPRMLQVKSVEKENDDEEDSTEERAGGLPIEIRNALEQGHASDEVMAKALKKWFGMADVDQDMQDFKTFTPKQMKLLDEVYENWAEAGITPKETTDTLLRHGHQGYKFDTVIDGYLKYLTAKFRAERIAKAAAAGPQ
ncbi:hypothetical protein KXD40_006628 [Peronospora effusa]|uniref:RxLR effector protein n=1 Tax=Peronospora effusa TaxID=542832 RepID=A0A3M6VFC1_9STRA|nr:hypothetical protein DD238_004183 [Peronospora effusa]RQM17581.1 hypothetical protein DD237_003115 [Peronospora effusa]UIZ24691.1 hypothetical protein KXD40_006628 [Peronospora effusa]CAI5719606.1 unnamed protein product [Peronospora effusa]